MEIHQDGFQQVEDLITKHQVLEKKLKETSLQKWKKHHLAVLSLSLSEQN